MSYVTDSKLQKLSFLINLNGTNNYKQSYFLPSPITGYRYVSIHSNQFFAVTTSFAQIGYTTDFYNVNQLTNQISGLIVANDIVKTIVTNNTISSLEISLLIPRNPKEGDTYQGVLVFSN